MHTEMNPHVETLAAWADGEPVDRDTVLRALADTDAREYVVDLMSLRQLVARATPTWAPDQATAPTQAPSRTWWRPLAIAASLLLCVAAGFVVGRGATPPPETNAGTVAVPVVAPLPQSAPRPTQVIQLKSGVDWRENFGGN